MSEFDDDIDWGSIELPTPTVTPSNKRQLFEGKTNDDGDSSDLKQMLNNAPTFSGETLDDDDGEGEDLEVGDELQLKAIDIANDGKNLFLTGKAGTGKSWATQRIVKCFDKNDKVIYVTAPTGIAAINIGGTTINHFGRFQLGEYYSDFNNMMSEDTRKKIKSMDALLIDEISMLDGHLFDVLECMITIIRCYDDVKDRVNKLTTDDNVIMSENMLRMRWDVSENGFADAPPFGGLQLIVVGDFYQLPPIPNKVDEAMEIGGELETSGKYDLKVGRQGCYAFESNAWQNSSFQTVELTEIHRQDGNDGLFEFLNGMRVGEPDLMAKHASTLASLQAPLPQRGDNIIPTELHSKNYMVNKINSDELHKLPDNIHEFAAHDEVELDEQYKQNILNLNGEPGVKRAMKELNEYAQEHYFARDCRVSHNIDLKKDAQVMLLWNLEFKSKLANGSRGVVKGFFPAKGYLSLINDEINERQDEMPGSDNREDEPEPLPIADGKSGDSHALITPSKMSQEETSPSIATQKKSDSEKKKITRFDFSDVNPEFVKEIKSHVANMGPVVITRELEHVSKVVEVLEIKEFPYVHFSNGKRRIIRPQPFEKEYKKVGTATRWQIPLTLAWAISIHKSQGMTIEWLQVNLMDCFAIGQCYVACSRGKCLNSMSVRNFKPTEVKISEKVKTFYNNVKSGKPYSGKTWLDTIEEFDKVAKRDIKKLRTMKQHYNNTKPCSECGKMCVVSQIKTNRNGNAGKFFIACPDNWNGNGHTWELVNTLPLSNTSTASGSTNTKDGTQTNRNNQKFKLLTPGVDGSIEGRLQDIRFVATGLFPELGGGEGLKIGRDNLKVMIESFGGKVTGSISGKTDVVVFGLEPGAKQLENAKAKGVPTIDRFTLHKILIGEAELPSKDPSQPPTKKKKVKSESYDC